MEPILCKAIASTPILQVVVLALGTLVSFLVAYFKNDVSIYLPFISENGAVIPEMGIFSSTVILGSFIGVFTVFYRYLVIAYLLDERGREDNKLKRLNKWACYCGIISMAGLAGVGAFPMSTILVVHLIVAGLHFSLAMTYLFIHTYISYKMKSATHQPSYMKTRLALCIFLTIFLVLLGACMPFAYLRWKKLHPEVMHSLKTPEDEGFTLLFCSALFEWLLYVSFLGYILTFTSEFRKFQLVVFVEPVAISKSSEESIEAPKSINPGMTATLYNDREQET